MNTKLIGRIVAAVVMGTVFGFWMHHREEAHRLVGRDAFMVQQGAFWDRVYNHPHHLVVAIVVCVLGAVIIWGLYELLAAGIHSVIGRQASNDSQS
jgi:hypothetical protein